MIERHIDPIPVREERDRLKGKAEVIGRAIQGADALEWFSQYANEDASLTVRADIVAKSTPRADVAQRYVQAAAAEFAPLILKKAIQAAQADFDAGVASRKPGP